VTIDRKTATDLAALYSRREALAAHKSKALDKNMWIGVLTRGVVDPRLLSVDARSYTEAEQVVDALGGMGAAAILVKIAVVEALEAAMQKLDAQIKALDGEV